MKEWMMMIQNVGFPIVVTLYLLHRIERKLDEVTTSILSLPHSLQRSDYSMKQPTLKNPDHFFHH